MTAAIDWRAHRAWIVLLLLALAAAVFLRCDQLGTQFLLDDEWHAIHKLLRADAGDIATHFGLADYSIPLTLYYRFLYLHGGLSEWGMRLPMLLAGIGLLGAAPWLLRRLVALPALVAWVGLMAISPMMIYHTRTARPYAVTTLLCVVAIFAFLHWWRAPAGRARWAALYVGCTFLAGWLHLVVLSFARAPFLFFGGAALLDCVRADRRAHAARRLLQLAVIGLVVVLVLAAALLPPLLTDAAALAAKTGTDSATLESMYRTLLICFGIASPWLLAVFAALCGVGLHAIWRRDRELAAYLVFVVVIAVAAIAASHAAWLQHQLNFARYMQPAVPLLLLFAAEGAVRVAALLRVAVAQPAVVAAGLAGLYAAGPIPGYLYDPNQFMGDAYFQFDYDPAYNPYLTALPHGPIPDFYRRLRALPPRSVTLIETPWSLETPSDPQPLYQAVHRQMIKVALTTPVCGVYDYGNFPESAGGMRFALYVHLSALLRGDSGGGDFLVVHLRSWPNPEHPPSAWPDMSTCLPQIEQHFGAPVYRDADIEAFALSAAARRFTATAGMR
jgi:hypothetical protein